MPKRLIYWTPILILFLAACVPGELEPGSDGVPVTRQSSTATAPTMTQDAQLETESASSPPTPTPPQTRDIQTPTPTPYVTLDPSLTTTPFDPPAQTPTPTPVPPLSGFRYETAEGIWSVPADLQPHLITNHTGVTLSPDGTQALYTNQNDIWLLDVATGESRNLTESSGRVHCCPQWWPARPDTIIFGSWPDQNFAQSTGQLSAVQTDGSNYTVLDENQSNASPAPSPDGRYIAYDRSGQAWIYDWETGESTQFNPADYGLENVLAIAGPSWSPDANRLAWTISENNPDWHIAVAVFDLSAGTAELFHPYQNLGRDGWFPGPAWHPDGDWLAFAAEDVNLDQNGVWVVSTLTGEETFIGQGQNPIWSPDGRWLTYVEYETRDNPLPRTWLVEVGSWYHINLWIPDGGHLLEWVQPQ
ncbi:MAG: hypothetical protein WAM60_16715 [Candidatus Promineifilaceae bacterium]